MKCCYKWKKIIACITAAAMSLGMCACGNQGSGGEKAGASDSAEVSEAPSGEESSAAESSEAEEAQESQAEPEGEQGAAEVTYPLKEKVHLTLAMVGEAAVTANATDLAATPFGQAWQEATGVELEIMQLADNEALNLLYASGELPDIIVYVGYTGGPEKAVKDKIIQPLNDYMQYAPDLQAVMDSNELYKKSNTTKDGDIIGFPFIRGDDYLLTSVGLIIRQDWLDDLNLELPQTPDELYEVLKAFKEEKGASVPMSAGNWWLTSFGLGHGLLTSPFGLVKGQFYQVDGKVHYGYAEEAYKDALAYVNKLYTEGLLDPNFQTVDDNTVRANIMNGEAGVAIGNAGGYMGNMLQTMEEDPTFDLNGFGPLVAKDGDMPMSTHYDTAVKGTFYIITPSCSNKEAAVQFLNYGYTEEGSMLFNFGIEGESYTMENGVPTYTELIMHNPEGLTKQLALAQYTRSWAEGPFVQDKGYMLQYADLPGQVSALTRWTTSDAAKYNMPPVTVSEADASEYSKLIGDIETYIGEMTTKYITGLESLDTFETEYLETLKSMGVERAIELQQEALDDFNAR
ncbi:MAG: extracellular solute-binding protein [Lachnospiraceae bacterium]|nr:extracellular solute-binding protein [uncultured Acetatifactor sp.]MCI9231436.1 extracellular solute-binding protein [Lachnospiraceae bacterium]